MKMRIILCLVLGLYSMAAAAYVLTDIASAQGCSHGCFSNESPFAGGDGSTSSTRMVNVNYRTSGNEAVPSTYQSKLSNSLNTAIGAWNGATDSQGGLPYQFRSTPSGSTTNVEIVYVDNLPRGANGRQPCMSLHTVKNPTTGQIESATLYISRNTLQNSSEQDLAELIEHELGHVIGLADFYGNADQCQTIMAQAQPGCASGLQGSQRIASGDVSEVRTYMNNPQNCHARREPQQHVDGGGGGYVDPNPSPYYYPQTCYYYYDVVDVYVFCDCNESGSPRGYRYVGSVYYLTDVFCTY